MAHYRLYLLGPTGHFAKAIDLDCIDDADAVEKASAQMDGGSAELWARNRLVSRLPAKDDHTGS